VGETIYFGNLDGGLYAHDRKTGRRRWVFRLRPKTTTDGPAPPPQVGPFVYWRDRIHVSTTDGLFCLEQDPAKKGDPPEDFVLDGRGR
jgi:outer membrane protein assembly factor BamB